MKETWEIQKLSIEAIRVQGRQTSSIHLVFKKPIHTEEELSVAYFAHKIKSLLSYDGGIFSPSSYVYIVSAQ